MAHEVGIINASHLYTEIKLKHRAITQNNKWFDPSKCYFRSVTPKHHTIQPSLLAKIGKTVF